MFGFVAKYYPFSYQIKFYSDFSYYHQFNLNGHTPRNPSQNKNS